MLLDVSNQFFPHVLIVDDEEINLLIMAEAIKDLAHVDTCSDSTKVMEFAEKRQYDLILLDIEMPDIDGYQVCQQLRENVNTANSSIIFVTSHSDAQAELKALQLGAIDFLTKPVDMKLCQLRVKNHLNLKRQEALIIEANKDIQELVRQVPIHISYWSLDFNCQFSNDFKGRWFELDDQEVVGKHAEDIFPSDLYQKLVLKQEAAFVQEQTFDVSFEAPIKGMEDVQVSLSCRLKEGKSIGFLVTLSDITTIKRTKRDLATEKERLKVMLNSIGDAVIATDESENVTFMNPIAEHLTGWTMREAKGLPITQVMDLCDATSKLKGLNPISMALNQRRVVAMAMNTQLNSRDGRSYRVEDSAAPIKDDEGNIIGAIIVFHDISESIAMSVKMSHLANHDQLTDLPNRILLHDRVSQACQTAKLNSSKVAVFLIDIDHFKYLNDTLGHFKGDAIILQVAKRLKSILEPNVTLARTGGDEFVLAMPYIKSSGMVDSIAHQVVTELNKPYFIDDEEYTLSVSVGISLSPDDAQSAEQLMTHADAAMYRAKEQGRNQYCYFSEDLEEQLVARHQVEKLLRLAIELQTFEVFYQPKYQLAENKINGVEALVRLRDQNGNIVPPDKFIPLAEETGLIVPLGKLILQRSCEDAQKWAESGSPVKVAVNIAAKQFKESEFSQLVAKTLISTGLDSSLLELEVTESALMDDYQQTKQTLNELSNIGLSIAIDDFGTGYSSLSYLKLFPVDVLKIDQSFIRDMLVDEQSLNIVRAIILLGQSLNLELVGEGIEEQSHRDKLIELGCTQGQGYWYSKPLEKADFQGLIDKTSFRATRSG